VRLFFSFIAPEADLSLLTATGKLGVRKYDPKRYGNIPGVPCGRTYGFREEASTDSIHAPFVAGISGGPQGAYSICVSGPFSSSFSLAAPLSLFCSFSSRPSSCTMTLC
jgi:hypothetical protein